MLDGRTRVRRVAAAGALVAALAAAGVTGDVLSASNADAAQARNGMWYHNVMVRSNNARVRCISMQHPGGDGWGGKTFQAAVAPRQYGSLNHSIFHYNGTHPNNYTYTFSAYTSANCTGNPVTTRELQEPEDSRTNWWVTI